MAKLTYCQDCGVEISKRAEACPKCGAPQKKGGGTVSTGTGCLVILVVIGIIALIASQSPETSSRPQQTTSPPPVTPAVPDVSEAELYELAKKVPASDHATNIAYYQRLVELAPDNQLYRDKVALYRQKQLDQRRSEQTAQDRKKEIERQFSGWDGSHRGVERAIKNAMNDPNSYDHVETRYVDNGSHLTVLTTIRGKNAFGGIVTNSYIAKVTLNGQVIELTRVD